MLNPSNHSPKQRHHVQPLKQLIQKHPFACCVGLWVALVILGSVATLGLLDPGPLQQEASAPTPSLTPSLETVQESTPKSAVKKDLPLSLFGAVALGCLGCAAGSLLISYALGHSTQRRQPPKRLKPIATVGKKRRSSSKRNRSVPQTPHPDSSKLSLQTSGNRLATTKGKPSQVTVLPPEKSYPLDRSEESLTDQLDLRKNQSLASILATSNRR